MKAVGYKIAGDIDRDDALIDIELPKPEAQGRDLLVEIAAVSVNPVDTKTRKLVQPAAGEWQVLGYDAVGTVVGIGQDVQRFAIGDEVFYAGSIARAGTNSEFHLVDERIVGRKPTSLSAVEAAALPLTAITAWEMLFDRLDVRNPVCDAARAILVTGGAGGVGSIAIQLLRALTDLTVIASASREETQQWIRELGAHHVVDHSRPMAPQIEALGLGAPAFVFSTTQTQHHLEDLATIIAPQGRFGLIDDPMEFNIRLFKRKSVSVHWEMMFTRSVFETSDLDRQGKLLNEVSRLVDEGHVKTTLTETHSPINAATLKRLHALIESGKAKGKIVVKGFR